MATAMISSQLNQGTVSPIDAQQKMVKKSLTKAFDELHAGQAKHNARNLFAE